LGPLIGPTLGPQMARPKNSAEKDKKRAYKCDACLVHFIGTKGESE